MVPRVGDGDPSFPVHPGSENGEAIMYVPPYSFVNVDIEMKQLVSQSQVGCIRRHVLNHFKCDRMANYIASTQRCCWFCDKPQREDSEEQDK